MFPPVYCDRGFVSCERREKSNRSSRQKKSSPLFMPVKKFEGVGAEKSRYSSGSFWKRILKRITHLAHTQMAGSAGDNRERFRKSHPAQLRQSGRACPDSLV